MNWSNKSNLRDQSLFYVGAGVKSILKMTFNDFLWNFHYTGNKFLGQIDKKI